MYIRTLYFHKNYKFSIIMQNRLIQDDFLFLIMNILFSRTNLFSGTKKVFGKQWYCVGQRTTRRLMEPYPVRLQKQANC